MAKSHVFTLSPDGSAVAGPQDLPVGTAVSFSEAQPAETDRYTFMGAEFTPENVAIAAGENRDQHLQGVADAHADVDPHCIGVAVCPGHWDHVCGVLNFGEGRAATGFSAWPLVGAAVCSCWAVACWVWRRCAHAPSEAMIAP